MSDTLLGASFRDPSGFLYRRDGVLLRQVNEGHAADYAALMEGGLYAELTAAQLLVPHREVGLERAWSEGAHRVLEPEALAFISYPYEWCFSQLQDAARCTLEIQSRWARYQPTVAWRPVANSVTGLHPVSRRTLVVSMA